MRNPPANVAKTLRAVSLMLGAVKIKEVDDWKKILGVISKADFKSKVLNFDTESIPKKNRKYVKQTFVDDETFTFDVVNRSSKACGPLCAWVLAQVTL